MNHSQTLTIVASLMNSKYIMTTKINYAEIAQRIFGKLKEINVEKGESLLPFMEQFEHLKLREGFVLDAYYTGEFHGGHYELYARNRDISEPFIESEALKDRTFFRILRNSVRKIFIEKFGSDYYDEADDWGDDWGDNSKHNNTESPIGCYNYLEGQPIQGEVSPKTSQELIPSIFNYIEYDLNEQSVWELFLLYESYIFMPLHWHAGYARCTYIFERVDLEKLVTTKRMSWSQEEGKRVDVTADIAAYLDDESLLPSVTILSENEALVRYSYWNSWSGLVTSEMKITKENGTTTFCNVSRRTLVEYHCGIIF